MATVTIDSVAFAAYADEDDADEYLLASFHASNWTSATELQKQMALVTATRLLDRQDWLGDKTSSSQTLEWPRTNTGVTGVTNTVIPEDIVNACIELALSLVDGSEVQSEQNIAQKIQSLRAGSVGITYFRGAEGSPLRFPLIVHELVGKYLAGATRSLTGLASGVDSGDGDATNLDFGVNSPL